MPSLRGLPAERNLTRKNGTGLAQVAQGQALLIYQCEEGLNADSLTIQDSVTEKVAKALAVKLSDEERN